MHERRRQGQTELAVETNIEGFNYPPYSFVLNPELRHIHDLALGIGIKQDELTALKKLIDLPRQLTEKARWVSKQEKFEDLSDNSPLNGAPEMSLIPKTQALHTYTVARLENLLRTQAVTAPEGTDNGISMHLSSELAKLSNAYRIRQRKEPDKTHFVEIAHSLAMYALRFKEPDFTGYSQTLGHWLHLDTDISPHHEDQFERIEETLKLSLALKEIGYGPEDVYVPFLVRDLQALYTLQDKYEEWKALELHYQDIPSIENPIEKYWKIESDRIQAERVTQETPRQRQPRRRKGKGRRR